MISLLACRLGRATVAPLQPSQHALADVDATVVDQIDTYHLLAVGFHDLRDTPAEKIVTDMTQVQGFVCVGRGIFYDYILARDGVAAKLAVLMVGLEEIHPELVRNQQVEKAFHHIELGNHVRLLDHLSTHLVGQLLGIAACQLHEGKHHNGHVALKLGACLLEIHLLHRRFLSV